MTVPMDNPVDLSSRDRVQRLYDKNVELGNRLRRSAQARIPSDFTVWQQMRENYEAIILEDHVFSEQHEIEYALWQLHYRRIEEFRTHCKAALASNGSVTSQNGTMIARPERITKIRSQFKTFLSEATGFYHDLMLKIRAKCGLPLVSFSDNLESQNIMSGEGSKATMMRKGLISCHRCLIYLGDLSRYKGLYGEGDSKTSDFSAASSYYKQASSLWPSSGNPHHQLGILATYSGDEFEAIYCYFRSLAVDNPFSTARDNLIIEFEKNRQSFSQLCGDAKASLTKNATRQIGRRGRGRGSKMSPLKDNKKDASALKKNTSSIPETLKAFKIRFVRLNGILFTRTSLETFVEVLSMVKSDLLELLSSGPKEEYNFDSSSEDNGLVIVRLVSILIFTIHNVNREAKLESYADILQRSVLLQNAFTAIFDLMGLIIKRCTQLNDPLASFLLPAVMIFLEWLACHPDFATGIEVEEHQAAARLFFWENCIPFLNKLLSNGTMPIDVDGEDACFSNMSSYDESETSNRLALWEDFELRGFLPLAPAQLILDFSRKQSVKSDVGGVKEKKACLQRILYAGKALVNLVRVGQQGMYFDSESKKFAIGAEPQTAHSFEVAASLEMSSLNVLGQKYPAVEKLSVEQAPLYMDGEEEDEVIIFKPLMTDRHFNANALELSAFEVPSNASQGNMESCIGSVPVSCDSYYLSNGFNRSTVGPKSPASVAALHFQALQPNASKWPSKSEGSISNGLNNFNLVGNGLVMKSGLQEHQAVLQPSAVSLPLPLFVNPSACNLLPAKVSDTVVHSKSEPVMSSVSGFDSLSLKASSVFSASSRLNPVSRPVHHLGPPPGFSSVPPKAKCEILSGVGQGNYDLHMDDYSWLDGYQPPSSEKATVFNNSINHPEQSCNHTKANDGLTGTRMFPFPGKQLQTFPMKIESQNGWLKRQLPDRLKLYQEWQQQQLAKIG